MKLTLLLTCLLAIVAVSFVHADALQDQIDAALKKFCGGKYLEAFNNKQSIVF
jgi:hypothetical protein